MILHSLCEYYNYKQSVLAHDIAPFGFEKRAIDFVIVIDSDGHFIQFDDTRNKDGETSVARNFMMPKGVKRTSGITTNLLWDSASRILGINSKGKPERNEKQKSFFIRQIKTMFQDVISDPGITAVLRFYELNDQTLRDDPLWSEIFELNPIMTFRLQDDIDTIVFHRPAVLNCYKTIISKQKGTQSFCLVYGRHLPTAMLHPSIKGVWGAQSSGASLVSFNRSSFCSFGKVQGQNAPVSDRAAFEYATALNYLLQNNNPCRIQLGNTSIVCWLVNQHPMEMWIPLFLGDQTSQEDVGLNIQAVNNIYSYLHNGSFIGNDGDKNCHVLGLSPNAARIAIQFWQVGTIAEFTKHLGQWFDDLEIINSRYNPGRAPLKQLLRSISFLGKDEHISSLLVCNMIRSILSNTPLPFTLLKTTLMRINSKSGKGESNAVNDYRASLIKAWLNRNFRNRQLKEVTVSLNPDETRIGYLLGRLFFILEKTQMDTVFDRHATIRYRYYSSASSTPKVVFKILMKLHEHHLKKINTPAYSDKNKQLIKSIVMGIPEFPSLLDLEQQGLFAIGYYHQRQDLLFKEKLSQEMDNDFEQPL